MPTTRAVLRSKLIVVQVVRAGCLLEADEAVARLLQLAEDGRESAVRFDLNGVGPVAVIGPSILAWPQQITRSIPARSPRRADDMRQIHIASQRGAGDDEFAGP